jgi:precorrin-6B methylase 2
MGRFSTRLAPLFADFAGVEPRMHALDVGAGTGALTA